MPERMSEVAQLADEKSSHFFDMMVDEALAGRHREVVVEWVDATANEGEGYQEPHVTIDGTRANRFLKRIMEYTTSDTDLIDATAKSFEEKMGAMWESTIEFYRELEQLELDVNALAASRDAGYWDSAAAEFVAHGIDPKGLGDGEMVMSARKLVLEDLAAWAAAVEDAGEAARTDS